MPKRRDEPREAVFHKEFLEDLRFWVSHDRSGASGGYVAAGGPGLTGPTDTAGNKAYGDAKSVSAGK